ncbi:MAG: UbiD family decarboxylase [Rhodospirillales bacterium]|nr:UbiD family decarboxylase [Rhodospirillales bacterium]
MPKARPNSPARVIADLETIIEALDAQGRLVRIKSEVDPRHDLAGIAARFEGGPRAVLFEKVKGHAHPVFTGLYWSRELLGDLMGKPADSLPHYVLDRIRSWQKEPVDPVVVKTGPVLEVTEREVDLARLPIPEHALGDGGPYLDVAVVIARDPETGVRNASIHRFQVLGKDKLGMLIDPGRHMELYLAKAAKMQVRLPITINIGVGPGLHFAAATPAEAAPADTDELGIASAFHEAPLQLVAGTTSKVEMVANAMYALECELVPGEVALEGPFAEVTGYYAKQAPRPVVRVKKIHRRKNPIFHTILSGVEVFNSVGLLGEANVLNLLRQQVPGVVDVYFSHGGCGFYHAVVSLAQKRPGLGKQAMMAAFAAFPPLKMVTVVDDDVDIRDPGDIEWAKTTRLDPLTGIVLIPKAFGHNLNPGFASGTGTKVGFDCTRPFPFTPEHDRVTFKTVATEGLDIRVPEIRPEAAPGVTAPTAKGGRGKSGGGPLKAM